MHPSATVKKQIKGVILKSLLDELQLFGKTIEQKKWKRRADLQNIVI